MLSGSWRYILGGLIIICFLYVIWNFIYTKKIRYTVFSFLCIAADFAICKAAFLFQIIFILLLSVVIILRILDRKMGLGDAAKGIIIAGFTCMLVFAIVFVENTYVGTDAFRIDVQNTYIKSVITTRRYSFDIWGKISFFYFVVLNVLLYVILDTTGKLDIIKTRKTSMFFGTVIIAEFIYTVILGGLYITRFAYENMQHGEYLTGFENYIQMLVIIIIGFWVLLIPFLWRERKKHI